MSKYKDLKIDYDVAIGFNEMDALQKLCDKNPNLFDKDSIWRKK